MEILLLEIRFDLAAELDGQRIALAVDRLADGDADPTFADAILLDVGLFLAVELYADAARQQRLVIVRALGIGRKAVGQLGRRCVCHAGSIAASSVRSPQGTQVQPRLPCCSASADAIPDPGSRSPSGQRKACTGTRGER